MVKTYDIDLDDELVENATRLFEGLGTDIDSAIKIFLKQSLLRKGFPFEITVPENGETENGKWKIENCESLGGGVKSAEAEVAPETENHAETDCDDLHGGVSEDEENACATASVPPVSAEIAARVAANEALVAQMRNEIGEKAVTPEFDENEDDGTHGDYDSNLEIENEKIENGKLKIENSGSENDVVSVSDAATETETSSLEESSAETEQVAGSESADEEDEDETTPENLFDAWDVGDEEDIGCK